MEQLIARLIGDYLLQTTRIARNKVESLRWALYQAAAYTVPFFLFTRSLRRVRRGRLPGGDAGVPADVASHCREQYAPSNINYLALRYL